MAITQTTQSRKLPVSLSLSEALLVEANGMTDNLSAVVESLLSGYIAKQYQERASVQQKADAVATEWNNFNSRHGSFSDEHSTL